MPVLESKVRSVIVGASGDAPQTIIGRDGKQYRARRVAEPRRTSAVAAVSLLHHLGTQT